MKYKNVLPIQDDRVSKYKIMLHFKIDNLRNITLQYILVLPVRFQVCSDVKSSISLDAVSKLVH